MLFYIRCLLVFRILHDITRTTVRTHRFRNQRALQLCETTIATNITRLCLIVDRNERKTNTSLLITDGYPALLPLLLP